MKSAHEVDLTLLKNSAPTWQQAIGWRMRTVKEMVVSTVRSIALVPMVGLTGLSGTSEAQLTPEWISRVPVGSALTAGIAGIHVDPDGVSYITGISGPSSNTDITTVSFASDGSTRWTQTWNSPGNGADQARGITMGANGVLYVVGNTPGPGAFANVLILAYDAATGALLDTIQYRSGPADRSLAARS